MSWYEYCLETEEESKKAISELLTDLKRRVKGGYTEFKRTKGGYFGASGFFKRIDGKIIYFSIPDTRNAGWWNKILVREAKDFEDFTGGRNNFCTRGTFLNLFKKI